MGSGEGEVEDDAVGAVPEDDGDLAGEKTLAQSDAEDEVLGE